MSNSRPLKEGTFGSLIVKYFEENMNEAPVDALFMEIQSATESTYRMTFADGSVADYKVSFEGPDTLNIESIEFFDQVI